VGALGVLLLDKLWACWMSKGRVGRHIVDPGRKSSKGTIV